MNCPRPVTAGDRRALLATLTCPTKPARGPSTHGSAGDSVVPPAEWPSSGGSGTSNGAGWPGSIPVASFGSNPRVHYEEHVRLTALGSMRLRVAVHAQFDEARAAMDLMEGQRPVR